MNLFKLAGQSSTASNEEILNKNKYETIKLCYENFSYDMSNS